MSETLTLDLNHMGWISVSETYQILCDLSNISVPWISSECCSELSNGTNSRALNTDPTMESGS